MSSVAVLLVCGPGLPGTTPNREGSSGLGAVGESEGAFRYPPHTLLTTAAEVRRSGLGVSVLDAVQPGLSLTEAVDKVADAAPAVVGVFVSWGSRAADAEFLASLATRLGGSAAIVAMGPSAHLIADDLPGADYVLVGEPDLAFARLARQLSEGGAPGKRRIDARALNRDAYDAQGRITDLDVLPLPDWDLVDHGAYPFLSVLSSRGCGEGCAWCPYVVAQGHSLRVMSPTRLVGELTELVARYHPRCIVFRDPAFAGDRERVVAICRAIIASPTLSPGENLLWECESHPSHLVNLVDLMGLAGCIGVKVGLETVEPAILTRYGRTDDPDAYLSDVEMLVRQCRQAGVASRLYAMTGMAGQSPVGGRETAAFVNRLGPTALSVMAFKRYPGVSVECGTADDLAAQRDALAQARDELAAMPRRRPPRWRRVLRRLRYRLTGGAI